MKRKGSGRNCYSIPAYFAIECYFSILFSKIIMNNVAGCWDDDGSHLYPVAMKPECHWSSCHSLRTHLRYTLLSCWSQWPHDVKAWTVSVHWNAGVVGSNPTLDMHISVRFIPCFCYPVCGGGLPMGWSPVQGVLPTAYRIKKIKKSFLGPTIGCRAKNIIN
jgi:hypothetical protein